MSCMKLIKLLYLVDRRSLLERGVPVTYDRYVSMSHGPVLSETLDLINYGSGPSEESYWETHVDEDSRYEVSLKGDCPVDELSDAELDLARAVYAEFGKMDRWAVVERRRLLSHRWARAHTSPLDRAHGAVRRSGPRSDRELYVPKVLV